MLIKRCALIALLAALTILPRSASAGALSLLTGGALENQRASLFATAPKPDTAKTGPRVASLFIGQQGDSLFAPLPPKPVSLKTRTRLGPSTNAVDRIRHLISRAESRRDGYDAVQHGAKIKPPARPTDLTVAEIYQWIDDTPGQPHAIGRYQFIPSTLKRLVKRLGVKQSVRFTPRLQDQLANILLAEAGLNAFLAGKMPRHDFMNNLAKIWAGLPTTSGKSYYHGYAGNKASMTWAHFDAEMAKITPG